MSTITATPPTTQAPTAADVDTANNVIISAWIAERDAYPHPHAPTIQQIKAGATPPDFPRTIAAVQNWRELAEAAAAADEEERAALWPEAQTIRRRAYGERRARLLAEAADRLGHAAPTRNYSRGNATEAEQRIAAAYLIAKAGGIKTAPDSTRPEILARASSPAEKSYTGAVYEITKAHGRPGLSCTCKDYEHRAPTTERGTWCKHLFAYAIVRMIETAETAAPTTAEAIQAAEAPAPRKSLRQQWREQASKRPAPANYADAIQDLETERTIKSAAARSAHYK